MQSEDTNQRVSEQYENSLTKNWTLITKNLEPRDIQDSLVEEGILSIEDNGYLCTLEPRRERVQKLIERILLRGDQKFKTFLKVLSDNGYKHISDGILSSMQTLQGAVCCTLESPPEDLRRVSGELQRGGDGGREYCIHEDSTVCSLDYQSMPKAKCQTVADSGASPLQPNVHGKDRDLTNRDSNPPFEDPENLDGYQDAISSQPDQHSVYETISGNSRRPETPPHTYTGLSFLGTSTSSRVPDFLNQDVTDSLEDSGHSMACSRPPTSHEDEVIYANERDFVLCREVTKRFMLREAFSFNGSQSQCQFLPSHYKEVVRYPGWNASISDKNIKTYIRHQEHRDGSYCLWYSNKNQVLVLTVIKSSAKNRCLHYKIKMKKEDGQQIYYLEKESKFKTLSKLLDFTFTNGLREQS